MVAAAVAVLAVGALVWMGVFQAVSGQPRASNGMRAQANPAVQQAGARQASSAHSVADSPVVSAPRACIFDALLSGRARAAESALIAGCHNAAQTAGAATVPQANAQMKLAQFYAASAQQQGPGPAADALRARALALVADSGVIYQRVLGSQASRTRVASQVLVALTQPEQAVPAPEPIAVLDDDELARLTGTMGAAAAPAPGMALRLALQYPELKHADHDLVRLQEQAGGVARDPDGFAQRSQEADARRQACPDEACIRQWYAQRRHELLGEFRSAP
jgi:hypothetical protein